MTVDTQNDRPKSVRNRCVIEVLVAFWCCPLVIEYTVVIGIFVIGLSQISFFLFLSYVFLLESMFSYPCMLDIAHPQYVPYPFTSFLYNASDLKWWIHLSGSLFSYFYWFHSCSFPLCLVTHSLKPVYLQDPP